MSQRLKKPELERLLGKMFVCADSWPTPKEVRLFHIQVARDVLMWYVSHFS
jgi:hypothetical protein